jgi:hypothetical protein
LLLSSAASAVLPATLAPAVPAFLLPLAAAAGLWPLLVVQLLQLLLCLLYLLLSGLL